MITDYNNRLHYRCTKWVETLTDPHRSLGHKAAIARFLRAYPIIHEQVSIMILIKLHLEAVDKTIVRNPNVAINFI